MQIKCSKCGAAIGLPPETQGGDVIRCGRCGKKLRVKLRATQGRATSAVETATPEPKSRRGRGWLRLIALLVLAGVGFAVWQSWPLNLGKLKDAVQRGQGILAGNADGAADGENALASQVATLFEERCHRCHGEGGSDEGGFNFVVRLDKLVEDDAYVTAGNPDDSYLFSRISEGEMPPADDGEPLSDEEIALVRQWIEQGAPPVGSDEGGRELVSSDDLLLAMKDDLNSLDEADRRETRYFTLTHLYNAGLSQNELETYRLALAKLLNSLSWERELAVPERVGEQETLLRINLRDFDWSKATWDAIVDTDPYAVTVSTPDGTAIRELTGTDVPNVRADWFVSRASRAPLYYDILEIPGTFDELLRRTEIGVNVDQNLADDRVVRAAFVESGVSDNNRMFERHKTPFGGLWVSYDFASSVGKQNVLQHPLGPAGNDGFQHDGGEIIFNLPNGLQGYMLVDADGKKIDKGPINIVADDKQADRAVVAGLSCMTCHANGMIRKQDEVRPTVLANRDAFPQADRILRQYPAADVLESVLDEDTERFESALESLGFERLTETSEPVFHMAKRFDQAVDRSLAAAEFGVSTDKFVELLDASPTIAKVLGVLKVANGKVKRKQFLAEFKSASEAFGLGTGLGETPSAGGVPAAVASATTQAPPVGGGAAPNAPAAPQAQGGGIPGGTASPAPPGNTPLPAGPPGTGPATPPNGLAGNPNAPGGLPPSGLPPGKVPPGGAPSGGPPGAALIAPLTPEAFLHQWTNTEGEPLVYARFLGVTRQGDARVELVPRQWSLESRGDDDYGSPPFSGTFWAFLQQPGSPVLARVGEVKLPGVPLNYVDYPRESFCEEDRAYLAHLEQMIPYAYVSKGRVRYYTLPWDVISVEDQQYVYQLLASLQASQPPPDAAQQPSGPPPGTPGAFPPAQGSPQQPPGTPPQSAEFPPDLPSGEPGIAGDSPPPTAPQQPYEY